MNVQLEINIKPFFHNVNGAIGAEFNPLSLICSPSVKLASDHLVGSSTSFIASAASNLLPSA